MVSKELKIHFFGDSICFGQGVSIIHGWVPRIAKNFRRISITELDRRYTI